MGKEVGKIFLFAILIILFVGLVSAGFWNNFWGKITGKPIKTIDLEGNVQVSGATTPMNMSCEDSDGGDIFTQGTVSLTVNGSTSYYQDVCVGPVTPGIGQCKVGEYTCVNNQMYYTEYYCPLCGSSGSGNSTTYQNCTNGACYKAEDSCTDRDYGDNIYVASNVHGWLNGYEFRVDDKCVSNVLIEQTCNNTDYIGHGYRIEVNHTCPAGYYCSNGACANSTQPVCTETDGGNKLYVKGTNFVQYSNGTNLSVSDYCADAYNIKEYWCNPDLQLNTYDCRNYGNKTCQNGICTSSNTTNTFDLAVIDIYLSDNTPEVGQEVIVHNVVRNLGNVGGNVTGSSKETCPPPESGLACMGAGGGGSHGLYIGPGQSLVFNDTETFSIPGIWRLTRSYSGKGINNESDSNLSNNPRTEFVSVLENSFCTDSDGGLNYGVKGIVMTNLGNFTDFCSLNATRLLTEYSCNGTQSITTSYTCGYQCSDGKCIAKPKPICRKGWRCVFFFNSPGTKQK